MTDRPLFKDYGAFKAFEFGDWLEVHHLEECKSFANKRAAHNAYKELCDDIHDGGYDGWITYVASDNAPAIRLMVRLGATPYKIINNYDICFVKEVV